MMALFFGIGLGLILLVRWAEGWDPIWSWRPIVTGAFLTTLPVGLLDVTAGFDYWARDAVGVHTLPEYHSGHGARSWRDYFRVNTDHKVIAIQYLVTTI